MLVKEKFKETDTSQKKKKRNWKEKKKFHKIKTVTSGAGHSFKYGEYSSPFLANQCSRIRIVG